MIRLDNYWLSRACRDHRVPPSAFRAAYTIMKLASRGRLRATTQEFLHFSGAKSPPTLLHSLDRLAALRYVRYERECRGAPLLIEIIHTEDRSAKSAA